MLKIKIRAMQWKLIWLSVWKIFLLFINFLREINFFNYLKILTFHFNFSKYLPKSTRFRRGKNYGSIQQFFFQLSININWKTRYIIDLFYKWIASVYFSEIDCTIEPQILKNFDSRLVPSNSWMSSVLLPSRNSRT
jgi:hypothetical protein